MKLIAGLAAAIALTVSTQASAQDSARLRIEAIGADLEFRTLNLSPDSFVVPSGESRTFQNLKPDRYVVVQAPPTSGTLTVQCSDGVSNMEYDLQAGDDLTCTFTSG